MTHTSLADTIHELAAPLAAGMGLSIWGMEIALGARSLVRIFVEKDGAGDAEVTPESGDEGEPYAGQGVSIEQCAELSRLLGLSLEVEDIVPRAYVLEISSPGLDRTFFTEAQLATAQGKLVEISLEHPQEAQPGRRKFRGRLTSVPLSLGAGEMFTLLAEDAPKPGETSEISFTFGELKKARQVYLPPDKTPPGKAKKKEGGKKGGPKSKSLAGQAGEEPEP